MHRVELKGSSWSGKQFNLSVVPNAPCGVESPLIVEADPLIEGFLMHRVELKGVVLRASCLFCACVPNAPCGVERSVY